MVLQHQRRRELCEQTYSFRPARVERRCGLFVVLHANIQGDSPSKRPPRGRNPILPLGRVTLADGRPCAVHRTPSVTGVLHRANVTFGTKTARRFLRKEKSTEKRENTERQEEKKRKEKKREEKKQKQEYEDQRKSQGNPLSP